MRSRTIRFLSGHLKAQDLGLCNKFNNPNL